VENKFNPNYLGGRDRRIMVRGQPIQKVKKTLSENKLKQKRAGDLAQVVEHLTSKHKALSLNSGTTNK
jgi:hypothetical protein